MASTKKPIYNVETKLAPERKRRKSDLVLMWQSFVDVTIIVVKELWTTIIRLWEFLQIWFSSSERFLVQTWLEKYLPYVPDDFSESWRDGRLLAILLNKLHPGCFPDAYHLDPDYGLKNVYRIFDALDIYFGIKPNVSVEEIVTCSDGSDLKLFAILLELKNLTDNQPENEEIKIETVESIESSGKDQNCIVKGTGLAVGFVGRISNFIIFCATIADLDVIVEIKGPNSVCSERITKRSPRKRRSGFSFQYARYLTRSASLTENNNSLDVEEDSDLEKRIIHLEYEIIGNQINLAYKPREKGEHKITILWHGQHVSDSPYFVTIEDPSEVVATKRVIPLKSAFKNTDASEKIDSKKISFQIENFQNSCENQEDRRTYKEKTVGKVISRKLIRYIVRINGKDIPVNADSIQALATELLKMDYNIDSCPSFHRRNSWGFAGDAERKKSVIRQFGIDVKELDAQISQKRTRSLSMYPGSKKILEKSDSFDSLTSKLNCLNEDIFENVGKDSENEGHYAYLNENAMMSDEMNEIRSDSSTVTMHDTYSEKNKNEAILLSEFTGSKFDKSLEKRSNDATEAEKNSSLSINKTPLEKIDRPEDDLNPNILLYSSPLKCKLINFDKSDDASITYQYTDKNLFTNKSELNHVIKNVNISSNSKIFQMCPKVNNYQKKIHKCSNRNFIMKSFYRKKSKMKIVPFSPIVTNLKTKIISKRTLNKQPFSVSNVPKNILIYRMGKTTEPAFNHEKHLFNSISRDSSRKKLNISPEFKSENKEYKKYKNIEQKCPTNKERKTNVDVFPVFINERFRTQSDFISSKNTLEEPECTKKTLKYNFNSAPNFSICSEKQIKDENKILNHQRIPILASPRPVVFHNVYKDSNLTQLEEKRKPTNSKLSKPLRIHTLKTCGQFNFAQFNPSLDSDNAISPIKSQIEHWENTLSIENESASPMKLREASDIEQGNVKEKLAFWECRTKESLENSSPQNNRKMNLIVNKKNSPDIPDLSKKDDLQKLHCSESRSNISVAATKEKNDTFINNETNAVANMHETDNEISPEFQTHSTKIRSLSFSDPLVSEITTDKAEITSSLLSSESSRKEYLDLSSDDTFEQYDSDETEDSGGDYLLHSTEDEYIDDEIAERASEYWGDLSIVKNWKVPNCSGNEYSFLDEQFLQNYNQKDKSYPEECKVFGIAVYYGYVAIKNRFQVFTGDAGFGNLSVSIQGVRRHEVSLVSISYMRNDIYEVTYQVMTDGYYLIWIRWMDTNIPGSPFVCKVTF